MSALDCYNCKNTRSPKDCNVTVRCQIDQDCGVQNIAPASIVGRNIARSSSQSCHECCSSDLCNSDLCAHLKPSDCVDDENFDCARLNTVFQICKDITHAKSTCPRFCNLCNVVDGQWSVWTQWSKCDVTCGNGTKSRIRSCSNPKPENGGIDCVGKTVDTKDCQKQLCPVHGGWSGWADWEPCSVTCGMGMQKRTRYCSNPVPSRYGDHCFGDGSEYKLCMLTQCADGGWSEWGAWSICPICSVGIRRRTRACENPTPSPYGRYCKGQSLQVEPCQYYSCYDDCYEIKKNDPYMPSGIYVVHLWKSKKLVPVLCDMDTDNGGWTVLQHRFNGSVDSYRNFANYSEEFGNPAGEFWLGLDHLHEMTSHWKTELRVDVEMANGSTAYEVFGNFRISPSPDYVLNISPGKGTAGDGYCALSSNNGTAFSTFDKERNSCANGTSCPTDNHGAWWYNTCVNVNLNGKYCTPSTTSCSWKGMTYYHFARWESLKTSKMMFRRQIQ